MEFTAKAGDFLASVKKAAAATGSSKILEIVNCVRITSEGGLFRIQSSNREQDMNAVMEGKIVDGGTIVCDPDPLSRFLDNCDAEEKVVFMASDKIRLKTADSALSMNLFANPEKFARIEKPGDPQFEIQAERLFRMISMVKFAEGESKSSRVGDQVTKSVAVKLAGDTFYVCATDCAVSGVAWADVKGATDTNLKDMSLLPLPAVRMLRSTFEKNEIIQVRLEENSAWFSSPRATLGTRLVDGRFPPIMALKPSASPTVDVKFNGSAFARAIGKVRLVFTDQLDAGLVWMKFANDKATLTTKGSGGDGIASFPSKGDGKEMSVAFSLKILSGLASVTKDQDVRFVLKNSNEAAMIESDFQCRWFAMPMHERPPEEVRKRRKKEDKKEESEDQPEHAEA